MKIMSCVLVLEKSIDKNQNDGRCQK